MVVSLKWNLALVAVLAGAGGLFGLTPEDQESIDALVQDQVLSQSPSATLAVSVDGSVIFARGWEAQPETLYRIGSVSKQFTAAGILALVEAGAVNLEAPWSPSGPAVTIERLLTMRSNLPDYVQDASLDPVSRGPIATQVLLDRILTYKPTGVPLAFSYSNTNYFLLASVIEAASGKNYRDYLRKKFFQPVGLASTGFLGEFADESALAPPQFGFMPEQKNQPAWPRGAGEIISNALDLVKWDEALFSGRILAPASLARMTAPAAPIPYTRLSYAMGFFVRSTDDRTVYGHGGNIPGYTAYNQVTLKKGHRVSVALLTNADSVRGLDFVADAITDLALDALNLVQ